MAKFKEIHGKAFGDEVLHVDGKVFRNCRFIGTTLVYSGGDPFFLGGYREGVRVEFRGPAGRTLETLRLLHNTGAQSIVDELLKTVREPFEG